MRRRRCTGTGCSYRSTWTACQASATRASSRARPLRTASGPGKAGPTGITATQGGRSNAACTPPSSSIQPVTIRSSSIVSTSSCSRTGRTKSRWRCFATSRATAATTTTESEHCRGSSRICSTMREPRSVIGTCGAACAWIRPISRTFRAPRTRSCSTVRPRSRTGRGSSVQASVCGYASSMRRR